MSRSFYLLPEWIGLMEQWCQAWSEPWEFRRESGATIRTVFFSNRHGFFQPPYMAYAGLEVELTPTEQPARLTRQWHELGDALIRELRRRRYNRWLTLPPSLPDARPFTWAGMLATPRYTYIVWPQDFCLEKGCSPEILRKAKKAAKLGYTVRRDQNLDAAWHNIRSTQQRQDFDYQISPDHLRHALDKLGADRLRIYNAYDSTGQPACSLIVLYRERAVTLDWIAATATEHLKSGVTQLARLALFDDLKTTSSEGFDFCGANIPSVANAKSEFGAALTPYFQLDPLGGRFLARLTLRWIRSRFA
ncbi:MAG: GNAT family N-acetyltransferase [Verrucomicrobiae bacterium]|nr:GNAT family N-acetyltransferase [Verrucomicrobiae bacterium]